jgi:serine/threonine protein kinase
VLQLLSEGPRGAVVLAEKAGGGRVALKLRRLVAGQNPEEALGQVRRLQPLTASPGLLPITDCGLTGDLGWLWEELVPASGLDGSPPSSSEDYQPATLRAELIEQGRFSTESVLAIGLTLCGALERLHASGWVHRDVKPGNLLRIDGRVVLGDYGLTAAPGSPFDFKGTEGFMPTEGAGGEMADLYALGKTLYELWTGCDRLEFPTVPRAVLDDRDWVLHGSLLNKVLLRACSPQARDRFANAGQFAAALRKVAQGRPAWVRQRRRIAAGTAAAAVAGLASLALFWPRPLSVRWEVDAGSLVVTVQGRA